VIGFGQLRNPGSGPAGQASCSTISTTPTKRSKSFPWNRSRNPKYSQIGALDQAVAAFEAARRLDDSPWVAGWLGYGYGRARRRAEAEGILGELRDVSEGGIEVAFLLALVYTGLGEQERALSSLEQASAERSLVFNVARYMPAFDPLRDDPRFERLAGRSPRMGS
jgi:serine/threonine-protein kinase